MEQGAEKKSAQSGRKKARQLILRQLLWDKSDEKHPISTTRMIQYLRERGVPAERKAIYDDMQILVRLGTDVRYQNHKGWYIATRRFQLGELKLLVDAVQAARFLSPSISRALIAKLCAEAGEHGAARLSRQVYVDRQAEPINRSVCYSVDRIHSALNANRAVTFLYRGPLKTPLI